MWKVMVGNLQWGEVCKTYSDAFELKQYAVSAGKYRARIVEIGAPKERPTNGPIDPPRETIETMRRDDLRHGVNTGED